jgi:hypothetical protein
MPVLPTRKQEAEREARQETERNFIRAVDALAKLFFRSSPQQQAELARHARMSAYRKEFEKRGVA